MNNRLDHACNRFKEEINTIEICLGQVGEHLAAATDAGVDALEVELDKATEKREAKREQAAHAGHRIKKFLEESKENVVTKFEDWKTDREIEKIEKDADKKEQQAVDAIVVAAYALLDAEVAIVDALKARKMAIEVAG